MESLIWYDKTLQVLSEYGHHKILRQQQTKQRPSVLHKNYNVFYPESSYFVRKNVLKTDFQSTNLNNWMKKYMIFGYSFAGILSEQMSREVTLN